jgi:hypothetical protein
MVMEHQAQRLSQPLRWTPAGKLAVIAAALCLAVSALGAGIYGVVHGFTTHSAPGCIDVIVPSTLGAANVHACGSKAKMLCATPGRGLTDNDSLRAQCRREGYAFRSSSSSPSPS